LASHPRPNPLAQGQLPAAADLLDLVQDAIVVCTPDGRIVYWSRGAQRIFGYTAQRAMGRLIDALMGPGAALKGSAMDELIERDEWSGELECFGADGNMVTVARRCTLRRDAGGTPSAVIAVNTEITERRRAEKEIVLLNNLLEQRIRRRTAELEESNEDLREFAYSLAHDLRAPLSSIDGFSAQLEQRLDGRLDGKEQHYLRRVRAGVRLMSDLTDGLLALADRAHAPLLRQTVSLSAVARNIVSRLREDQPQIAVDVEIHDTPPAQGDARLLADVLENLLGNAFKFSARTAGARIEFGADASPNGVPVYYVKDNGAGFDPSYAYKLFGPFQRLHAASEFAGTGIGLAIVRKIVARHGGRVWAESAPGEGAVFYFTLNESQTQRQPRTALAQPHGHTAPAPLT
jgi:PAS domain S-box-containing protein